jgi:intein/homing endonuclease
VSYDTQVLLFENKAHKVVSIGEWIDEYMDNKSYTDAIKKYGPEEANMELLDISKQGITAYIQSCDDDGIVQWHNITNVSRHDPSEYVYNIKTKFGREVTVVASKSLIVWDDDTKKFVERDTEDIVVGDKLPVTFRCPATTITTHVNMRNYLYGKKYIYGTDYNNKMETIKKFKVNDGYVYARCAKRNSAPLPELFELNRDNGFFIGVYLAEGNTCKDYIGIANNDQHIRNLVAKWFESLNITHNTQVKAFNPDYPGLSTSIRGYSTLLVEFLESFLGKYSNGKYIPNEAYAAPDEFVKGLIDGYISGDGCITDHHVVVTSVSQKLINGVAQLLARYGIFSKLSTIKDNRKPTFQQRYILSVQSEYVYKFGQMFTLSHKSKQEKLQALMSKTTLGNMSFLYKEQNDVILDSVKSIEKVLANSDSKYKKVYDITVPNTLNFQLYNGLCIRDTSDTGYVQRRLVKAMEDCKIYYDQTVRNATGVIVQFLYGEDGMDGTKMETQYIPTISKSMFELDMEYHIRAEDNFALHMTDAAAKQMTDGSQDMFKRCTDHFNMILEDREFLIQKVFHGEKNDKITYPIPFERIINSAIMRAQSTGTYGLPSDLTPQHALDKIDELIKTLKIGDIKQGTRFLQILVRVFLSPKPLIMKHHMSRAVFDWIADEVQRYYIQAIAQAGEMVGIVAAQTMGENSTQLVLDSFHSSGTVAAVKATSGVPRFKELLSVSKNIKTPILLIYLQKDIGTVINPVEDADGKIIDTRFQETKEKAIKVMNALEITRLSDILDSSEIFWDPPGEGGLSSGIPTDDDMLDVYRAFEAVETTKCRSNSPWLLRMKFNRDMMYRIGLTMLDIYIKIHSVYSNLVDCTFSDDNAGELIFRIRMTDAAMKDVDTSDTVAALKAVEHNLIHNVLLKGVKGIKKVSMHPKTITRYNSESASFEKVSEWILDTDGTNLQEIFANPNVDAYRTRSNDVWEIYHTLGIEAARNALYNEIIDVIGEGGLNYRHLSLLLDTMTNRGQLMSIDRHGINRGDVGPLAKSSFEETTDMLINASIFSEYDKINGVSANIMLGQLPPCGTGDSEIILDEEQYIKLLREVSKKENVRTEAYTASTSHADRHEQQSDPCGYSQIAFTYTMPDASQKHLPSTTVSFV